MALLLPKLKQHRTPFADQTQVTIPGSAHQLGHLDSRSLLVLVELPAEEGQEAQALEPTQYLYTIEAGEQGSTVEVCFVTPQSGTIVLTTITMEEEAEVLAPTDTPAISPTTESTA